MFPRTFSMLLLLAGIALASEREESRPLTFERDVRPILKAHCTQCHGEEEKPKGGVDLRLRRFMDKELEDGDHVLVPGKPEESEMVRLIREGEMPKKGKKAHRQTNWRSSSAGSQQGAKTAKPEPEYARRRGRSSPRTTASSGRFNPSPAPAVPTLENAARVRTPIDAFILAKLRAQKLDFAPDADQRTLLRRVTLDLTGLPPTSGGNGRLPRRHSAGRLRKSGRSPARLARLWRALGAALAGCRGLRGLERLRRSRFAPAPCLALSRLRHPRLQRRQAVERFIVEQLAGDELAGATQARTRSRRCWIRKRRDQLDRHGLSCAWRRMARGDPVDD